MSQQGSSPRKSGSPRRSRPSLDELPEFNRDALEVLRQPLEDGVVSVSRVSAPYIYPADFLLLRP
jgi:hypothetical protein